MDLQKMEIQIGPFYELESSSPAKELIPAKASNTSTTPITLKEILKP